MLIFYVRKFLIKLICVRKLEKPMDEYKLILKNVLLNSIYLKIQNIEHIIKKIFYFSI